MHSTPSHQPTALPSKIELVLRGSSDSQQPEPLLSLLTSQHPLLSTAINGSLSAYSSSKSFSPRFKSGAEFVERHIGSPVATTVGTAGRISGVETGVRWWLQRSDSRGTGNRKKRRRIDNGNSNSTEMDLDVEKGLQEHSSQRYVSRRSSEISEALPAYDDDRSPSYEEHGSVTQSPRRSRSPSNQTWQTRLIMSTSGLGVAMSDESLRSLKYCLNWLRWSNNHLGRVMIGLRNLIDEWDRSQRRRSSSQSDSSMIGQEEEEDTRPAARDQATIFQNIQALKGDVLQTLRKVISIVSTYAGGALPENARLLVRKHLKSLPERFHIANTANSNSVDGERQSPATEMVTSAQRMMVLAKEGLDMMAQVSMVVDGTIVSAEEWCQRLGRRRSARQGEEDSIANRGRANEKPLVLLPGIEMVMKKQDEN